MAKSRVSQAAYHRALVVIAFLIGSLVAVGMGVLAWGSGAGTAAALVIGVVAFGGATGLALKVMGNPRLL